MSKFAKKILIFSFIILAAFAVSHSAFAQGDGDAAGLSYGEQTGLGNEDPRIIVANIIRIALGFLGILGLSLMLYAGWLWMTAAGNEERIEKAKKLMTGAVIGLVIILSAFGIVSFILSKLMEATGGDDIGGEIYPPGGCANPPCGGGYGSGFYINGTNPAKNEQGVYRNAVVRAFLTRQANNSVVLSNSNFKVEKVANINVNINTGEISEVAVSPELVAGTVSIAATKQEISFKPSADCGADSTVKNCFDSYARFRVTINADSSITSASNQSLECSAMKPCDFEFTTNNAVDDGNPTITNLGPSGGFCKTGSGNPTNDICLSDSDCSSIASSSVCDFGTPNGATGNFVTISGMNFGTSTGKVYFGGIEAQLADNASTGNPLCADSVWQDNQIIAVMPAGLASLSSTTVKVVANGYEETSRDNHGPKFTFIVNNIGRPGLCKLDPQAGTMNTAVSYYGVKFDNGKAYFGSLQSKIEAIGSSFASAKQGSANVPNIQAGMLSTFVLKDKAGSNFMSFNKQPEPYEGPYITAFDATQGAIGQYVTIRGGGFGSRQGLSKVYFGDAETGKEASFAFPDICADTVWSDKQVIVKVPAGIADGSYKLTMVVEKWTVDTASITPSTFKVDSSLKLTPSLCRLDPATGQNNTEVAMWGEYFDTKDANSKVRFSNKNDQSGTAIGFWGKDASVTGGVQPDKATTTIHAKAISGPVKLVKGSPELSGNGLNLKIGACVADDDCGGTNVCCPSNSVSTGRCKASLDECFTAVKSCVYEWDFSTGSGSDGSATSTGSCSGYSLNQCSYDKLCPNSPGQCSPNQGGETIITGSCDYSCNSRPDCEGDKCAYDPGLNKCVKKNLECNLPKTAKDLNQKDVAITCVADKWQMSTTLSCPDGWTSIGGNKCTRDGSACSSCDTGFRCTDDKDSDDTGLCTIGDDVCSNEATCASDGKCKKTEAAACECCCRIDKSAQDCCSGLKCQGTCGSDTVDDSAGFGVCGGCTRKTGGVVDQSASDAACNCTGTTGKFCDTTALDGVGACMDCASLKTGSECSKHTGSCCVDARNNNACSGGTGYKNLDINGVLGYCGYFQCNVNNNGCDADNLVATSSTNSLSTSTPVYRTESECVDRCNPIAQLGLSCASATTTKACDNSICTDFSCLNSDGTGPTPPSSCGTCCCDPNKQGDNKNDVATYDNCNNLNTGTTNLTCQPNKTPCDSKTNSRGLCCGCTSDSSCGNGGVALGCGLDACCRARPSVIVTSPADGAVNICRNSMITADFNQQMSVDSFNGNVLVVGDYGAGQCPAGTQYITLKEKSDGPILVRMADRVISYLARIPGLNKMLFGEDAYALAGRNYCAIRGEVNGEQLSDETTRLTFSPQSLMDASRTYHVIVKGEANVQDATKEGVLSTYNVGMSEDNAGDSFNNMTFTGAKIWSFTTMADNDNNRGACAIESISVEPDSYLFQTVDNDLNEKDNNANDSTFDTVKDADKVFVAEALGSGEQRIAPIQGVYSWNWSWKSDNTSVIGTSTAANLDSDKVVAQAQSGIVDGQSKLNAIASISDGTSKAGYSDVYLLICGNPWPYFNDDGTWAPWSDSDANCGANTGSCSNTNQQLYYCRDAGKEGTADDLPALKTGSDIVTRGSSTNQNVLKEAYFLRETLPGQVSSLTVTASAEGQALVVQWPRTADASKYKIYYGTSKGTYPNSMSVAQSADSTISQKISGLKNGTKYYFVMTSINAKGAESAYSAEVTGSPKDTAAPQVPAGIKASSSGGGSVTVSWTLNADDTNSYRIYYGTSHAIYGQKADVDKDTNEVEIKGLSSQNAFYYFAISAIDIYGNESDKSDERIIKLDDTSAMIFKNALTNVDFESGAVGGYPSGWTGYKQKHSAVGISRNASMSGKQSVLMHQDANLEYPGKCSQELCNDIPGCTWLIVTSQCSFSKTDNCKSSIPAIYSDGETLCWANTNNTMFASLSYDVAPLNWQVGKKYLVAFYYKGILAGKTDVNLAYSTTFPQQCTPNTGGAHINLDGSCKNGVICSAQSNKCCNQAPVQEKCYAPINLAWIDAGDYSYGSYDGWNLYFTTFDYTSEAASWLDKNSKLNNQIGISFNRHPTGTTGSDLYIDDFIVAELIS